MSDKFASFKKEREKIADAESFSGSGTLHPLTTAALYNQGLGALVGGVGDVLKPSTDVAGYRIYKHLFPGLVSMMAQTRAPEEAVKSMFGSAGGDIGKGIVGSMGNLVKGMLNRHKQVTFFSPRRKAIVSNLFREDPIIGKMPRKQILESLHSMSTIAPTLSTDKNAVKSFLHSVASSPEGGLDWNTLKGLAETEQSILKTQGLLEGSKSK